MVVFYDAVECVGCGVSCDRVGIELSRSSLMNARTLSLKHYHRCTYRRIYFLYIAFFVLRMIGYVVSTSPPPSIRYQQMKLQTPSHSSRPASPPRPPPIPYFPSKSSLSFPS